LRRGARIALLARAPRPGAVKTRLIPALGAEGACRLHCRLVERSLALASALGLPVELWLDGDPDSAEVAGWCARYAPSLHRQGGGDLGRRMQQAAAGALRRGAPVLLLGGDCPTLQLRDLRRALRLLGRNAAVLAPAHDGGYVLLGLRHSSPALFARIPWGTRHVLRATRGRLARLGWRHALLDWQHDLDRPADLRRLGERSVPAGPAASPGT